MKSILVIPALNPPAHLLEYVDQLIASGAEHLVLVDDGSASEYKPIFEKLSEHPQCHILTHTVNQGKGRALKDAFAYILEQPQWAGLGVITADSDGQHLATDIRRMDQEMEELHRKEDRFLLLGCRNFHQGDVPFRSRFGNLLTCSLFRLLYGVSVTDTQTGLRGISWDLLSHMCQLSGERFEYEMNMLTDAALSKTPVHTLEISTVYLDNNSESHFNPLVDSIKIYRILFGTFLKYAVSSLFSSLVDLVCFTAAELLLPAGAYRILEATVIARIISSLVNFSCNKKLVFSDKGSTGSTLPKYYALCVVVMLCSAGLVSLFSFLPVPPTLIKIVVDTVLYLLNYQIQRRYIFKTI